MGDRPLGNSNERSNGDIFIKKKQSGMNKRTKAKKKTRLTDNEVKGVAKMQQELDAMYYMLFHLAQFARGYGDGYALLASSDVAVNNSVKTLYNFIKEHREDKQ